MVNPIPTNIRNIWDDWNIRGLILFSLSLQITLTLFAPLRKGFRSKLIKFLIWSAYLLADWAANFGVGLIADRARDNPCSSKNNELFAFWAPFMLIHLGGPDSITAFALADNELWLRHLLGLIFQAVGAVYVFLLTLPGNKMSIPTVLVFIAGTIKYSERIRALYLASAEKFEASSQEEKKERERWFSWDDYEINIQRDWDDFRVAYVHFEASKSLFVDLSFGTVQNYYYTSQPVDFGPEDALRKIEIELNLIYQVFHTKTQVTHSILGIILRFICFGSVVAALSIFYFQIEKHSFNDFEVKVTYILLLGAIALDVIAFFMFVFSDETLVALSNYNNNSKIKNRIAEILRSFLVLKSSQWQPCTCHSQHNHEVLVTPLLFPRWSGSVSGLGYNRHSPSERPSRVHKVRCMEASLSREPLTKELWEFLFHETERKRGSETDKLGRWMTRFSDSGKFILEELNRSDIIEIMEDSFDSLDFWHDATDDLYKKTSQEAYNPKREVGKMLSDYMNYLNISKPTTIKRKGRESRIFSYEDYSRLLEKLEEMQDKDEMWVNLELLSLSLLC